MEGFQDDLDGMGVLNSFLKDGSGESKSGAEKSSTTKPQAENVVPFVNDNYDSMLEALPDELNLDFTSLLSPFPAPGQGNDDDITVNVNPYIGQSNNDFYKIDEVPEEDLQQGSEIINSTTQLQPITINNSKQQNYNQINVDSSNQQNGEIAQFWDFNVDTLNITPSNSSGSATISAPNSYNSEIPLGVTTGFNNNNNNHLFAHGVLGGGSSIGNSNIINNTSLTYSNQQNSFPGSSLHSKPTTATTVTYTNTPPIKENQSIIANSSLKASQFTGKRPISVVGSNNSYSENPYILSAANTSNSVRKNSLPRQLSSTSLNNYRKSVSSSERPPDPDAVHCDNCKTYKTPLWRRSPEGKVLCNACGLFQKLHGTMRPLSLKTDVIRKRNSKKRTKIQMNPQQTQSQQRQHIQYQTQQNSMQKLLSNHSSPTDTFSSGKSRRKLSSTRLNQDMTTIRYSREGGNLTKQGFTTTPTYNSRSPNYSNSAAASNTRKSKSRRSSTSSVNSNSSRSSSRSNVPILPKISGHSSSGNSPMNIQSTTPGGGPQTSNSVGNFLAMGAYSNSLTSSPRNASIYGTNAPSRNLSSSASKYGVSMPGRKLSRNASYSSSFINTNPQQTQDIGNFNDDQSIQGNGTGVNSQNIRRINSNYDSPQPNFDLFRLDSNKDSPENIPDVLRSDSRLSQKSQVSHTSLLSQQIQNQQRMRGEKSISQENLQFKQTPTMQGQPERNIPSRTTSSASYSESVFQQRGMQPNNSNSQFFENQHQANSNTDQRQFLEGMSYDLHNGDNTIKTVILGQEQNFANPEANGNEAKKSALEQDLDWLKFGI